MSAGSIVFKPANGAHAVIETVFFFEFAARVLSDASIEERLTEAYTDALPRFEKTASVEVTFDAISNTTSQREISSYTFSTGQEGEAPEWAVRIQDGMQISIHCTAYTRWDAVSKQAFHFLHLLTGISEGTLELRSLGFKVVDQFIHDGSEGAYDLNKVFKIDSKYISRKNFESGERWHNNSGWLWIHPNGRSILNNFNTNSSAVSVDHVAAKTYVTIDHVQMLRREDDIDVLFPSAVGMERFVPAVQAFFEPLHEQNKLVVSDLLTDETCRRLSLVVGDRK